MNKSKNKKTIKKIIGRGKDTKSVNKSRKISGSRFFESLKRPLTKKAAQSVLKTVATYNANDEEGNIIDNITLDKIDPNDFIMIGHRAYTKEAFTTYINNQLKLPPNFTQNNQYRIKILQNLFGNDIIDPYRASLDTISKINIILEIYADLYSKKFKEQLIYLLKQSNILSYYYESNPNLFEKMAKMIVDNYIDELSYQLGDKQLMRMINTWNYYIDGAIFQLKYITQVAEIEQYSIDAHMDFIKNTEDKYYLNDELREEYIKTCYAIHSVGQNIYTIIDSKRDLKDILLPVLETLMYALQQQRISIKKNEKLIMNPDPSNVVDFGTTGFDIGFMGGRLQLKAKNRKTRKLCR